MYDLLIKNGRLVGPDQVYAANILIKEGKFAGFVLPGDEPEAEKTIDAAGCYLFPGIIDCHAHLNEPGFDYREDFYTGSRAAAAAGCTTLIDMPLNNNPSLLNKNIFEQKLAGISRHSLVDFALWGGIVGDDEENADGIRNNIADLADLEACGVAAFKGFTCPNGPLFPTVNLGIVRKALETLKPYNALCGFHCEEYGQIKEREADARKKTGRSDQKKIRDFLDAHDVWTEYISVKSILDLVRATGGRVHICHVSHPMVAQAIKEAIQEGLPVTAETCPHYLMFTEDLVFEKGAPAKCTPPLRTRKDADELWNYVLDGTLSCIGSDHSPAADAEKGADKDIWHAWGGLNTIQYFLPMMFDFVVHQKKESPCVIARTMGTNPARLFGLSHRKGAFALGLDADLVLLDPDKEWTCDQNTLYTKGHVSCLDGLSGKGAPVMTIVRGQITAENGRYKEEMSGYGQYIPSIH